MQTPQEQIEAAVVEAIAQADLATTQAGTSSASFSSVAAAAGTLGMGEIIAVSSLATGSPEATLELDAIGAPKRRVVAPYLRGTD